MIHIPLLLVLCTGIFGFGTIDNDKKDVLNEVFKSESFNEVYHNDTIYVVKNDLVINGLLDSLNYERNIVFIEENESHINYVVLSRFVWDPENRIAASIQLQAFPDDILANYRLKNKGGSWLITGVGILDE